MDGQLGQLLDIGVLVTLGAFLLIGLSSGLVFSAFRVFSIVVSLIMSLAIYRRIADLIYGTYAETVIGTLIYGGFRQNPKISAAQQAGDIDGVLDAIRGALRLPRGMAEAMFSKPESLADVPRTQLFNEPDIVRFFSDQCARAVIAALCVIAAFAAIRVIVSLVKIFLDEIAAMKMFNLFNYCVGPALGLAEGVFTVYVALALVMLINIIVQNETVDSLISTSRLARSMYENNLFVTFMLRRIGAGG